MTLHFANPSLRPDLWMEQRTGIDGTYTQGKNHKL